jgi:hypothetical protein
MMARTPETPDDAAQLSPRDAADLAKMARSVNPLDRKPKAPDKSRVLHAEQLVDKVLERARGGIGVVTFIGAMLGQLGEHVEANGLRVDWESMLIYATRTEAAGVEADTHAIIPKGTLTLVLDITVRPGK